MLPNVRTARTKIWCGAAITAGPTPRAVAYVDLPVFEAIVLRRHLSLTRPWTVYRHQKLAKRNTFGRLFVIQNAQARDSKDFHLKLDELLRAVETAREPAAVLTS